MAPIFSLFLLVLVLVGPGSCATVDQTGLSPAQVAKAVVNMCISETSTDIGEYNTFIDKGTFPDDKKCYFQCLMQAARVMDKDGNFDKAALGRFTPDNVKASVDQCIGDANKESDQCKKSYNFHSCLRDNQKDWYVSSMKKALAN